MIPATISRAVLMLNNLPRADGVAELLKLRCTLAAHVAGNITGNGTVGGSDDVYIVTRSLRIADAIITRALETTSEG